MPTQEEEIDILIQTLKDPSAKIRANAVGHLGKMMNPKAVEPLVNIFLKDEDPDVQSKSAAALQNMGTAVVGPFIQTFKNGTPAGARRIIHLFVKFGDSVTPLLLPHVKDKNPELRALVVEVLGKIGSKAVVPPLLEALKDQDTKIALKALDALSRVKDAAVLASILECSKDASAEKRAKTAECLSRMPDTDESVKTLTGLLKDPEAAVRSEAAEALGVLRAQKALDPLMETLKDPVAAVRLEALTAIGKMPDPKIIPAINPLANDPDNHVREKALELLALLEKNKAADALIQALKDKNPLVRAKAAESLGNIKDAKVVQPLIDALNDENEAVQSAVYQSLEKLKELAADSLMKALKHGDSAVRLRSLHLLEGVSKAVGPITQLLKDVNDQIRTEAAQALGKMGEPAVDPLIQALKDENVRIRSTAAASLGYLRNARAAAPLVGLLKDSDIGVRFCAADALGKIASESAIPDLIAALKDDNEFVREKCVAILALFKEAALKGLLEAMGSGEANVRAGAAKTLGRIGSPKAAEVLVKALKDEQVNVRVNAVEALAAVMGEKARDPLAQTLKDADASVTLRAAWALGFLKDARALPVLIETMKNENAEHPAMTDSALEHLGSFAVEALVEVLKTGGKPDFRSRAAVILGKIEDKRAVDPLIKALEDKDMNVKANAVKALGCLADTKAIDPLVPLLKDVNETVRLNAVTALGALRHSSGVVADLKCPKCQKSLRVSKDQNFQRSSPGFINALFIVGSLLTPFLIGIPVIFYAWSLKSKQGGRLHCVYCNASVNVNWYD